MNTQRRARGVSSSACVCVCILKAAISKQSIKTQADGAIKIQENSAIFFSGPENPLFYIRVCTLRTTTKYEEGYIS